MLAESAGRRMGFVLRADSHAAAERTVRARLGETADIRLSDVSLREVFVALASKRGVQQRPETGAAA
jgi:hypothetical protein